MSQSVLRRGLKLARPRGLLFDFDGMWRHWGMAWRTRNSAFRLIQDNNKHFYPSYVSSSSSFFLFIISCINQSKAITSNNIIIIVSIVTVFHQVRKYSCCSAPNPASFAHNRHADIHGAPSLPGVVAVSAPARFRAAAYMGALPQAHQWQDEQPDPLR